MDVYTVLRSKTGGVAHSNKILTFIFPMLWNERSDPIGCHGQQLFICTTLFIKKTRTLLRTNMSVYSYSFVSMASCGRLGPCLEMVGCDYPSRIQKLYNVIWYSCLRSYGLKALSPRMGLTFLAIHWKTFFFCLRPVTRDSFSHMEKK